MQTPWEYRYAHRTQKMGSSVIRELLKLTEDPAIISFGGGLPAPDVFPMKEIQAACNHVLEHDGAQALQYGTTDKFLGFVGVRSLDELPASDVLTSRQIDAWLQNAANPHKPGDADMGLSEEELPLGGEKPAAG